MTDIAQLRRERDDNLLHQYLMLADSMKFRYHEWVTEELKDLLPKAQTAELEPSNLQPVKGALRQKIARMRDIDQELQEACRNIVDICRELRYAMPDELVRDAQQVEDGLSRFRGMVRELLDIREYLDNLLGQGDEQEQERNEI